MLFCVCVYAVYAARSHNEEKQGCVAMLSTYVISGHMPRQAGKKIIKRQVNRYTVKAEQTGGEHKKEANLLDKYLLTPDLFCFLCLLIISLF